MKIRLKIVILTALMLVCGNFRAMNAGNMPSDAYASNWSAWIHGSESRTSLAWNQKSFTVAIAAPSPSSSWSVAISPGQTQWCTVKNKTTGKGSSKIRFELSSNNSHKNREIQIMVNCRGGSIPLTVTQRCIRYELPSIAEPQWFMEYPTGVFALEYSIQNRHPKWVAWILHTGMSGNFTRTEAWKQDDRLDPYNSSQIDFQKQRNLTDTAIIMTYDRGHLCPSNDRKASAEMNAQTFFYSNMSPQLPDFNQGIWARLESCVNKWAATQGDTLFICAGGSISDESGIALRTSPAGVAIPKYYFKVVLRKRGTDNFDAIGFWFEHRNYGRKNVDFINNIESIAMSVDEIERRTGLDFFRDLPLKRQNQVEMRRELTAWSWQP